MRCHRGEGVLLVGIHRSAQMLQCNSSVFFEHGAIDVLHSNASTHCVRINEMRHILFARKLTDSIKSSSEASARTAATHTHTHAHSAKVAQTNGQMCFVWILFLLFFRSYFQFYFVCIVAVCVLCFRPPS